MHDPDKRGRFTISPLNLNERIDIHVNRVEEPTGVIPPNTRKQTPVERPLPCCPRQPDPEMVANSVLDLYHNTAALQFSEMLETHKEILSQFMEKDRAREENVMQVLHEITELTRINVSLKQQNQRLRDLLSCRHQTDKL